MAMDVEPKRETLWQRVERLERSYQDASERICWLERQRGYLLDLVAKAHLELGQSIPLADDPHPHERLEKVAYPSESIRSDSIGSSGTRINVGY